MTSRYHGPIIDAHHHLWDLSLGRHPWITSADSAIKALGDIGYLRRDYLVADYLADIGHEPVEGSVYVEAAWDRTRPPLEEIAWLEGLARPRQIAARSTGSAASLISKAPASAAICRTAAVSASTSMAGPSSSTIRTAPAPCG